MAQEMPDRKAAHLQTAGRKLRLQSAQRQVRLLGKPPQNEHPLGCHHIRPPATHRLRLNPARLPQALRPAHHRRNAHPELRRSLTAGPARFNRTDNTLTKIRRISSSHPCWPPFQQAS